MRTISALVGIRITPAYAGKSRTGQNRTEAIRDHPRVCGEKMAIISLMACLTGSPPRMRGKATRRTGLLLSTGITPAYAGKSYTQLCLATTPRDHPRVCGEKHKLPLLDYSQLGSPPRMRGKDAGIRDATQWLRITPAYAGKSHTQTNQHSAWWDHPRVCGEKA